MDLNLTSEEWASLQRQRETGDASTVALNPALDKVLAHRPEPVLEDGIWESPLGNLYRVRAGEFVGFGTQLMPSDPSGWTPLRVLADDEVAVHREVVDYAAEACEETRRTATAGHLRDLLAKADQ